MSKLTSSRVSAVRGRALQQSLLCGAVMVALLQGCSSAPEPQVLRPVLSELPAFNEAALTAKAESGVTEQQLEQVYQQLLSLAPAPAVRQKVLYRLSQLRTSQLERQELPLEQERAALLQLITDYQHLLQSYPEDPNNELIHYQLARSYDLLGQSQASQQQLLQLLAAYPYSDFAAESWFRVADIYYAAGDYDAALDAFEQVMAKGEGPLKQHAHYMAGWSQFQLGQYQSADQQFLLALDQQYLSQRYLLQERHSQQYEAQPEQTDSLQQELLRILSVSLSMQQQAESLTQLLTMTPYMDGDASQRPLSQQAALYQALADFLFDRQLDQAALRSYAGFISAHADSLLASEFQLKIIQYYLSAGDADAALQAQQQYVSLFGPDTAFWHSANLQELLQVAPYLRQYLDYLVRQQYQLVTTAQAAADNNMQQQLQQYLLALLQVQAATPELTLAENQLSRDDLWFLLAETEQQLQLTLAAFERYQQLAYPTQPLQASLFNASQAAYRALLLAGQLHAEGIFTAAQLWQHQQDFIVGHSQHPAAVQVALQQLQQRYNEQDYQHSIVLAQVLIDWPEPAASAGLLPEVRFIRSQAQLALPDYPAAEQSLRQLLSEQQPAERLRLLQQQLASSIYQQAQAETDEVAQLAQLERLLQLPKSALRVPLAPELVEAARYQQLQLHLQLEKWPAATALLLDYKAAYPAAAERYQLNDVLLQLYQQQQQWPAAATLLMARAAALPEGEQQRLDWWQAIAFWQQAGDMEQERLLLRQYAHRYPQPHAVAQQSRWRLAEIYHSQQDSSRQLFWLQRLATAEQQQPQNSVEQNSTEGQALAADALLQLGLHEAGLFRAVPLRQPLASSLQRKQRHMTAAVRHFEQSMAFNQAEFYSRASFELAQLYQQMASALLQSDRPGGLSALALEQYDMLLEEQAYPFEELAIELYQSTAALSAHAVYDSWVQLSLTRLAELYPARFLKQERYLEWADVSE
ncbi:tetratricopeptide repeat protein [Arsukibacterium sp.]|uniref:tetratricopeptide repeat protein n=1 Tax=Arsukibacterium sp. TaxID=1977258 RepID=UPI002FDB314C